MISLTNQKSFSFPVMLITGFEEAFIVVEKKPMGKIYDPHNLFYHLLNSEHLYSIDCKLYTYHPIGLIRLKKRIDGKKKQENRFIVVTPLSAKV